MLQPESVGGSNTTECADLLLKVKRRRSEMGEGWDQFKEKNKPISVDNKPGT